MGFVAGNAQHIGSRPQQQDAFGFTDPTDRAFVEHGGFLGIVADGVGGLTHGSEASQSAVRTFLGAYHLKSQTEPIPDALLRSLRAANEAVLRVANAAGGEGSGTTLAAAVLSNHSLYWITAGDTRIYLLHAGRLTQISTDHTYARELDEQAAKGKISQDEAQHDPERGSLTSYLGLAEPKELGRNVEPLAVHPDDSIMVCTDGFYRALDESEIVAAAFPTNLQYACEHLVHQALAKQRKGQDNLTVIALKQSLGRQKWPINQRSPKYSRSRVLTLACVVVVCIFAAGYWWSKKYFANLPQRTQPKDHLVANPTNGAASPSAPAVSQQPASAAPNNEENTSPNSSGDRGQAASGHQSRRRRHSPSAQPRPPKPVPSQSASQSTPSSDQPQENVPLAAPPGDQAGTEGTTSSVPGQKSDTAQPATQVNGQGPSPATGDTAGTQPNANPKTTAPSPSENPTENAPASNSSQPPETNGASPPAGAQQQAPPTPAPARDNEQPKTPPTAPPADEQKPPPNLAFGRTPEEMLSPECAADFSVRALQCSKRKDGQL